MWVMRLPLSAVTLVTVVASLLALPASAAATAFRSPSGNIGCFIDTSLGVRCDIAERNWSPPAKPASCDLDYGQGVSVFRSRRARFVCAGDTALNQARVLRYGQRITRGAYTCTSRTDSMRCNWSHGKHGFRLSRQAYRLY